MQYVNYDELIQKYGVELQGWTFEKLVNSSLLSMALPGLRHLLDTINNGNCKFIKLSPLKVKKRCEELQKKQDEGITPVKACKPCKDRGTKRPHTKGNNKVVDHVEEEDNDELNEDKECPCKCRAPKSAETVPAEMDD